MPALVGTARARDMVLTGRPVSAAEAYFIGLCDRLVEVDVDPGQGQGQKGGDNEGRKPREVVLKAAIGVARDICEGGPVATRAALQAVNMWGAGEEAENSAYEAVMGTEDRDEALRAFAEKRKPSFKGR